MVSSHHHFYSAALLLCRSSTSSLHPQREQMADGGVRGGRYHHNKDNKEDDDRMTWMTWMTRKAVQHVGGVEISQDNDYDNTNDRGVTSMPLHCWRNVATSDLARCGPMTWMQRQQIR